MQAEVFQARERHELKRGVWAALDQFSTSFPKDRGSKVVIKPNLNSNLDALTGNTTDLRLMADVVEYLKDYGYTNITIAEGYNSGFHRDGVSVIKRNRVDRLAEFYGVDIVDLNYADGLPIQFEDGVQAQVARICLENDFFINLPKLKMHYEVLMTVALKSLIGTLVGRENKTLTHKSLVKNILRINDAVRPDLQVVDALIAMEGTGPSAGTPLRMDTVLVADDPYLTDLVAARLFSCKFGEVPVLKEAIQSERLPSSTVKYAQSLDLSQFIVEARRPHPNIVARMIINPRLQKYFIAFRNAPVIRDIISNLNVKKVLLRLGITQEIIVREDRNNTVSLDERKCEECQKCTFYCPVSLEIPNGFSDPEVMNNCIDCLYCSAVCPNEAIQIQNDLGFYGEQIRRYGRIIRSIA